MASRKVRLKWPLGLMDVGDFAMVYGVPQGRVVQYVSVQRYATGRKFACKARKDDTGRPYVLVRRYHDDGTPPRTDNPQVFYMDGAEQEREHALTLAREGVGTDPRTARRLEALQDTRGATASVEGGYTVTDMPML